MASVIETVNRRLANRKHTKTTAGKTHTLVSSPFSYRSIKSGIKLSRFSCWRQWQSGSYFTFSQCGPRMRRVQTECSRAWSSSEVSLFDWLLWRGAQCKAESLEAECERTEWNWWSHDLKNISGIEVRDMQVNLNYSELQGEAGL